MDNMDDSPALGISKRVLGVAAVAVAGLLLVHYTIFAWSALRLPYPLMEYDTSVALQVQYLLDGLNPYAMANQPQCTNLYGIGYPLMALPFAWLGMSPDAALRTVSLISFCLTIAMVGVWLRQLRVGPWPIFVALGLLSALLMRDFTINAMPNALGQFFFVAALFVSTRSRFSNRGLALAIGLTACGALCKLYFLAAIYIIGLYVFLRISKVRGLVTVGAATLFFACLYGIVDWMLPAYWLNTVEFQMRGTAAQHDVRHALVYGAGYAKCTLAILPLVALFLLDSILRRRPQLRLRYWRLLALRSPLFRSPWVSFSGVIIGSGLIILFGKLAYNNGAALSYYNHFLTPSLVIAGAWMLSRMRHHWLRMVAILAVLANLLFLLKVRFPYCHDEGDDWRRAEELIAASNSVAAGALLQSIAYSHGKPIFASTMSDYALRDISENKGRSPELEAACETTIGGMITNIQNRKYDYLLFGSWLIQWPGVGEAVEANYEPVETLYLDCPIRERVWNSGDTVYTVYAPRATSPTVTPMAHPDDSSALPHAPSAQ